MAWFPAGMPVPEPTIDDAPFWAHCAAQRLCFQACAECGLPRHPPTPLCPRCRSTQQRWIEAPGEATVYTFTVVHHAAHPAIMERLPYIVAVVEFPDLAPVRLVTNLTDVEPSQVRIGMRVTLWWDGLNNVPGQSRICLPRFRPTG